GNKAQAFVERAAHLGRPEDEPRQALSPRPVNKHGHQPARDAPAAIFGYGVDARDGPTAAVARFEGRWHAPPEQHDAGYRLPRDLREPGTVPTALHFPQRCRLIGRSVFLQEDALFATFDLHAPA